MKTKLAEYSCGRVILHLACLIQDGHWRWHWAGVLRELSESVRPAFFCLE